jgi:hypothetical protein
MGHENTSVSKAGFQEFAALVRKRSVPGQMAAQDRLGYVVKLFAGDKGLVKGNFIHEINNTVFF